MKVGDLPVNVLADLQERGWHEDDEITPEKAFDEYVNWHGLIGWGPVLRRVWAEIVEIAK